MRFSKLIQKAVKVSQKGKDNEANITEIVKVIEGAVVAYKGTAKGAFKANKGIKVCTSRGEQGLGKLDEESLLVILQAAHMQAVADIDDDNENMSLNAELARALATNPVILGTCYWLGNPDTAATALL